MNGKPLYYSTKQVAQILEEPTSRIRYWCDCFDDFLNIQRSGQNRQFTEQDIEKLKYIRKLLKKDGLTINQVKEYCSEKDVTMLQEQVKSQDPIAFQALATAIMTEMETRIELIQKKMIEDITTAVTKNISEKITQSISAELNIQKQYLDNTKKDMKDYISVTVEDKLNENIDNLKTHINATTENLSKQMKNDDVELVNSLKKHMEERRQHVEDQSKKGFFSKLFKR
ncbi:MerR family transcriptional regulator [Clostridium botulinum]|uniref:MerR family transcriptional regulator n=1 Tax=Clostridium botulinum TaxID=1491 RepID=UPI0009AE12AE|nr:MerR family transcriptional regulator [Clostridium botulinum]